jgi:hypothetical protein
MTNNDAQGECRSASRRCGRATVRPTGPNQRERPHMSRLSALRAASSLSSLPPSRSAPALQARRPVSGELLLHRRHRVHGDALRAAAARSEQPSAAHPDPVVLVRGTFGNMTDSWEALSPLLANAGYCVYALNYGGSSPSNPIQATGPIETSAQGRHRRPFAGRHDAALLPPLPRRRGQGGHAGGPCPEQPRHDALRPHDPGGGLWCQRVPARLRCLRRAAGRLRIPRSLERRP